MATAPSKPVSPGLQQIVNTDLINAGTGGVSGVDYMYVYAVNNGKYEIINEPLPIGVNANVSGPMSNPNFPTFTNSYVKLQIDTFADLAVVNISGTVPSGVALRWDKTQDNASGGFDISGNLYTLSAAEYYIPVTQTATAGKYTLPTGQIIVLPATADTGVQSYRIMDMPGPWPAGATANTSATLPSHMAEVHTTQARILAGQVDIGMSYSTLFSNSDE